MYCTSYNTIDYSSIQKEAAQLIGMKNEIIKSLSLYYYTFVDILDFKVNAMSFNYTRMSFNSTLTPPIVV